MTGVCLVLPFATRRKSALVVDSDLFIAASKPLPGAHIHLGAHTPRPHACRRPPADSQAARTVFFLTVAPFFVVALSVLDDAGATSGGSGMYSTRSEI